MILSMSSIADPNRRAHNLVNLLGRNWFDCLETLPKEETTTLFRFIEILRDANPDISPKSLANSAIGLHSAAHALWER